MNLNLINQEVSRYFQVSIEDMKSETRKKEVVYARHIAIYIARETTPHSCVKIATELCRDHATVCHTVKKIKSFIELSERGVKSFDYINKDIQELKNRLMWFKKSSTMRLRDMIFSNICLENQIKTAKLELYEKTH